MNQTAVEHPNLVEITLKLLTNMHHCGTLMNQTAVEHPNLVEITLKPLTNMNQLWNI